MFNGRERVNKIYSSIHYIFYSWTHIQISVYFNPWGLGAGRNIGFLCTICATRTQRVNTILDHFGLECPKKCAWSSDLWESSECTYKQTKLNINLSSILCSSPFLFSFFLWHIHKCLHCSKIFYTIFYLGIEKKKNKIKKYTSAHTHAYLQVSYLWNWTIYNWQPKKNK